jgi:hypothetical protein
LRAFGADFAVDGWAYGVPGAHALAVLDDKVGLVGGYRGLHDRLVLGTLAEGALCDRVVYRIVMPDGRPVEADARIIGRDSLVHVVSDNRWLTLDIRGVL